jgi:hypothetical protein
MLYVPRPGSERIFGILLRARVLAVAKQIENEARERVRVASGETHDSGRTSLTDDGARVSFGGAARWLEFGAYGREYPFLRPAADAVVPGGRRGK